jgi:hypothetical protein
LLKLAPVLFAFSSDWGVPVDGAPPSHFNNEDTEV